MSEIKLPPCPFCGTILTNEKPSKLYVHEKTGCIMDLRGFTEDQLEAWNTRKPMERIVKRLEEMKMRYFLTIGNTGSANLDSVYEEVANCIDRTIEIIKEGGI